MTPTDRAIAAEVRFVISGRNARLDLERHCFLVKSESTDRTYEVTIAAQGELLRGTCTCPAGRRARHGVALPCKHVAGTFHRGEREGWASFVDGRWVVGPALAREVAA